jgi:hypothetical protein
VDDIVEDEVHINLSQNEMDQVQRIRHLQIIKSLKSQSVHQPQKIQLLKKKKAQKEIFL